MPATGPISPVGEIPTDTWPRDGFYDISVNRLSEPPSTLAVEIRRWVPCAALPDRCEADPPANGIVADPATTVSRFMELGPELTVIIWTIELTDGGEAPALVGAGPAFGELLLTGLDHAVLTQILEPIEAGDSLSAVHQGLERQIDDPQFPFGQEPTSGELGYRGPHDTYLTAFPYWLEWDEDPWPPGANGLYNWGTTLEIRDGKPILYLFANQIAG